MKDDGPSIKWSELNLNPEKRRDILQDFAAIVTIVVAAAGALRWIGIRQMLIGWIGPVAVIGLMGFVLATLYYRTVCPPWAATMWCAVSAALIAQGLARSGMTWHQGLARWTLFDAPVVLAAMLLGSCTAKAVMFGKIPLRRKLVATAVSIAATIFVLSLAGEAVSVIRDGFVVPTPTPAGATRPAITTTPKASPIEHPGTEHMPLFPAADSACVARFGRGASPPDGLDKALWVAVLLVAQAHSSWKLCRVAGIQRGQDGLVDIKVFSATSGPEGHILVRRDIDGTIHGVFVKPQAGQLYYQQPGGEPLVNWGLPDADVPCGDEGRLVIFRRVDHSIEGFSRWSASISETTKYRQGSIVAYYTPTSIAVPLLTVLERRRLPLPPASGPVALSADGSPSQNFSDRLSVASGDLSSGDLTTGRLLARCAA